MGTIAALAAVFALLVVLMTLRVAMAVKLDLAPMLTATGFLTLFLLGYLLRNLPATLRGEVGLCMFFFGDGTHLPEAELILREAVRRSGGSVRGERRRRGWLQLRLMGRSKAELFAPKGGLPAGVILKTYGSANAALHCRIKGFILVGSRR